MLHIIGLGLADERDISVKGLEIVKKAERVYLEAYTAVLLVDQSVLVRNEGVSQVSSTHLKKRGRLSERDISKRHLGDYSNRTSRVATCPTCLRETSRGLSNSSETEEVLPRISYH